jgi:hypothetical protein
MVAKIVQCGYRSAHRVPPFCQPHWIGATVNRAMRILVLGDEPKTASYLRNGLAENGFVVDVTSRGDRL